MEWIPLTREAQLSEIAARSAQKTQVIFKHSTRCSISSVVMQRLKKGSLPPDVDFYYLDLLAYRPISAKVAEQFDVQHESPQILIIRNGDCVFDESHLSITMDDIAEHAGAA